MTTISANTNTSVSHSRSQQGGIAPTHCVSLTIVVSGVPVPQDRRVVPRKTMAGKAYFGTLLDPETRDWRQKILRAARGTPGFPEEPWTGGVRVTINAYFRRTKEQMRKSAPDGPIRKNTKPDADNLTKSVCDALTPPRMKRRCDNEAIRAAYKRGYLWHDDGQVHLGPVDRWYHAKGAGPGLIIRVERIPEGQ